MVAQVKKRARYVGSDAGCEAIRRQLTADAGAPAARCRTCASTHQPHRGDLLQIDALGVERAIAAVTTQQLAALHGWGHGAQQVI